MPILILTDNVCAQINFLHKKVGGDEWSGILLYSHEEGSIENADKLVLKAEEIFLMDIGTASGTEYVNDVDSIIDLVDNFPRYEEGELKMGHVHSHHSMKAYFSNVDMDELQINSPSYNYYLSLIVNFKSKPVAKISTLCDIPERVIEHKGANGVVKKTLAAQEVMGVYDVIVTESLSQSFYDRYSIIKKKKEEEKKKKKKAKKLTPRIPQTVKGWDHHGSGAYYDGFGDDDQQRFDFDEPDFSDEMIDEFVYKWFNLSKKIAVTGDVEGAVEQVKLLVQTGDSDIREEYVDQLDGHYEDFAITIIGNDYFLTDDEYLKLTQIVIQKLEPFESNSVIKDVINNLQIYEQTIKDAIEEYERT